MRKIAAAYLACINTGFIRGSRILLGNFTRKVNTMSKPSSNIEPITFEDVRSASEKIYRERRIEETGLLYSPDLSDMTGMHIFLKQEYTMLTGSFKERGVVNTLLSLTEDQKRCGVIAASAGNHAQALAYHGSKMGIPVDIIMPKIAPVVKQDRTKKFGGNVKIVGDDLEQSKNYAMQVSRDEGKVYVHGYDDATILAGQGTVGMEVHEQMAKKNKPLDAIVVPVGGGGLMAGISVAMKHLSPNTEVIGAESDHCDAFKRSFEEKKLVTVRVKSTLADGLAVSPMGPRSFKTALPNVDRVVTVSEDQIAIAILRLVETMKTVVEGAAATGLAACLFGKLNHLKGKNVVVVLSGANIDTPVLIRCLDAGLVADERLATFRVIVNDRPGRQDLSELVKVITEEKASIRDLFHERPWVKQDKYAVEVRCVVYTNGKEHCKKLKAALEKKFDHVLWGKDEAEKRFLMC